MEYKIGEIVTLPDGRKAKVVESDNLCIGCIFYKYGIDCLSYSCSCNRSDHKYIIYKEVKEK